MPCTKSKLLRVGQLIRNSCAVSEIKNDLRRNLLYMRIKFLGALCVTTALCATAGAVDWPSTAGNPQRDGWAQGESTLNSANVTAHKVKMLYKYKFDTPATGLQSLSSPVDLTNIIGYTGFHQLLFVGSSADVAYALDSDEGVQYFKTKFQPMGKASAAKPTLACPGGMTANMVLNGKSSAGRFGGGGGFGRGVPMTWAVSSDGYIHSMRLQDGNDSWVPATKFVPADSYVTGLNFSNNVLYAATVNGCGGNPNGLYAAAYTSPRPPSLPGEPLVAPGKYDVTSFMTNGSGFSGTGGTAISTSGDIVYGQVAEGHGDVAGTYSDTVLALDPKTLTVKDYFTPSSKAPVAANASGLGVTPVVFQINSKDVLVAGGRDGRLYLLDAASMGGSDHHTPLAMSEPVVQPEAGSGSGIWGTFATWVDEAHGNTRWLYASVRGVPAIKVPGATAAVTNGAVVAFKVEMKDGKAALTPQWISRDMVSPTGPAIGDGLVVVLSTGLMSRATKKDGSAYTAAEVEKGSKNAVLYILDGTTGRELYSSGSEVTSFANNGLALANGKVYFTTHDNALYSYGVPEER